MSDQVQEAPKEDKGPVCVVCGKPLTDPESIALGVGPLCRAKGWTKEGISARMSEIKQDTVPEGWIKLSEAADACRLEGIPVSRLVKAIGGDRAMEDPIDPIFNVIYVGRSRWVSPEAISEKGFNMLKAEKPKKEKKAKTGTPTGKQKKATKVVPAVELTDDMWDEKK